MNASTPQDKAEATVYEQPLGDERKYVRALAARYPGTIEFEAGCGHILYDLLARLPSIPQVEDQKAILCNRIVEAVHPLAACLFAQSVHMTLIASSGPLAPPAVVAGLATYSVFDIEKDVMRHCFLSAPEGIAYDATLTIASGIGVLCEPIGYTARQFDDKTRDPGQRAGNPLWHWTERMIHDWYEQKSGKPFVPVRLRLQVGGITEGQALGVVDAAAMAALKSTTGAPTNALAGKAAETHKITSAFIHEAGFAETAAQRRSAEATKPKTASAVPAQTMSDPATDFRTSQNPGGTPSPGQVPVDPRTGRVLPAGITDLNKAIPVDPVTGKALPVGVTDPRNVVKNPDEAAPKDAHDHLRHHHGPETKPDVV